MLISCTYVEQFQKSIKVNFKHREFALVPVWLTFQQNVSAKSKLSSRCSFSLCCFLSLLRHLLKPEIVSFFFNFSYSGFVLFLRLECCERCPSNSVQCQTSTKIMKVDWLIYWVCISRRRF